MSKLAKNISKKSRGEKVKVPGRSKRKNADTGQKSDKRQNVEPRSKGRGTGSEYAYAVGEALGEGKKLRNEAREGYLGVPNRTLNPRDRADERVLYKGKKKSE